MNEQLFKVAADYEPAGDQADAIELLAAGIESGLNGKH